MTLLLTHRACLDHLTPPGHPERPDRFRAVDEVLAEDRFNALVRGEAPEAISISSRSVMTDITSKSCAMSPLPAA